MFLALSCLLRSSLKQERMYNVQNSPFVFGVVYTGYIISINLVPSEFRCCYTQQRTGMVFLMERDKTNFSRLVFNFPLLFLNVNNYERIKFTYCMASFCVDNIVFCKVTEKPWLSRKRNWMTNFSVINCRVGVPIPKRVQYRNQWI